MNIRLYNICPQCITWCLSFGFPPRAVTETSSVCFVSPTISSTLAQHWQPKWSDYSSREQEKNTPGTGAPDEELYEIIKDGNKKCLTLQRDVRGRQNITWHKKWCWSYSKLNNNTCVDFPGNKFKVWWTIRKSSYTACCTKKT